VRLRFLPRSRDTSAPAAALFNLPLLLSPARSSVLFLPSFSTSPTKAPGGVQDLLSCMHELVPQPSLSLFPSDETPSTTSPSPLPGALAISHTTRL